MVEITLVRHGQAQSGANDEASYDKLSELGETQADWLGTHLAALGGGFDRIVCGGLQRQRQTAERIGAALGMTADRDARLNELDYFGLVQSMQQSHALAIPTDRETFLAHMVEVMNAWSEGRIASPRESFEEFAGRVRGVIADHEALGGRVILVTSGGVIGMAMRVLLRLDTHAFAHVLLQIRNTSVHRYVKAGDNLALDTFNAVPHLERPDRLSARTFV